MKKFLEKDLEEIIFNTNKDLLDDRGLYIRGKIKRQLNIGAYGIADLVAFSLIDRPFEQSYLYIEIIELKKDRIGISAFLQAVGYAKGIKSYLEKRDFSYNYNFDISIKLIGSEIDKQGNFIFLTDLFSDDCVQNNVSKIEFYTYTYDIDGLRFKNHSDYEMINDRFNLGGGNE